MNRGCVFGGERGPPGQFADMRRHGKRNKLPQARCGELRGDNGRTGRGAEASTETSSAPLRTHLRPHSCRRHSFSFASPLISSRPDPSSSAASWKHGRCNRATKGLRQRVCGRPHGKIDSQPGSSHSLQPVASPTFYSSSWQTFACEGNGVSGGRGHPPGPMRTAATRKGKVANM